MYSFQKRENINFAENVSAIFLYPDFTPEAAPVEEASNDFCSVSLLLSGDTPADVLSLVESEEYLISPDCNTETLIVASLPLCPDGFIACEGEKFNSEEVISVRNVPSEEKCPMFLFMEHIPSSFYVTVCSGDFYDCPFIGENGREVAYCCSVRGFVPDGMELKIRVQNFRL